MAKQVRETKEGAAISAYVVLNKKGEQVATINAHYSNGGTVSVDVWNIGEAVDRSFATACKTNKVTAKQIAKMAEQAPDYYKEESERIAWAARDLFGLQQSKAGGYGYDKFAAALAGLIIDGHTMANHCGQVPEAEKKRQALIKQYQKAIAAGANAAAKEWREKARRIGCDWANWDVSAPIPCWRSLYFASGFNRLEYFGYRVIQAI